MRTLFTGFLLFALESGASIQTLHSLARLPELNQRLHISDELRYLAKGSAWQFQSEETNFWKFFHGSAQRAASLQRTTQRLSDLTDGTQFLMKEFHLMGFETLSTQWYSATPHTTRILKVDLKEPRSGNILSQYHFEFKNLRGLMVLTCPIQISKLCPELISRLEPLSPTNGVAK